MPLTVELLGRPGCHLCDDALVIVRSVLSEFPEALLVERNILDDVELFESVRDDIPVILINGQSHARWRVDEEAFRTALIKELS